MEAPDQNESTLSSTSVKPPNVDIQFDFDALTITYQWRSARHFILLFISLALDVASVLLFGAISLGNNQIFVLTAFVSALLGLTLTYYTLAGFLNHTVITVNLQWLIITHGPLFWCANKRIEITRIFQLYAPKPPVWIGGRRSPFGYKLNAILRDNSTLELLSGLSSPNIARFIEQSVEEYIHIEDHPVAGEIPKY